MAPLFLVINLSSAELPPDRCKDGLVVFKIPGLCIGGDTNISLQTCGFVVFKRGKDSQESKVNDADVVREFHKHVFWPFVARCKSLAELDPRRCVKDHVCSWMDGDYGQMKVALDPAMQERYLAENIHIWKHAAAASLVEQPNVSVVVFAPVECSNSAMLVTW